MDFGSRTRVHQKANIQLVKLTAQSLVRNRGTRDHHLELSTDID